MTPARQGGFLIAKVHQAAGRIFARMLRERGMEIHPAQGRILFVLWQEGPMTINELAKRVSLGKSTLTNALDRLESSGEAKRVPSAEDRRKIMVQLTPKNKATKRLYEEVSHVMAKHFYRGFAGEEIARFEKDLERILGNLGE
jgi:MarR family transcriptional regulator, organic hydroperoxide resistance regulator